MRTVVCGYNHFGFIEAVARGFDLLPDGAGVACTHPHVPLVKMQRGWFGKRLWHGRQIRRINRDLVADVRRLAPDLVVCIEGSVMLPETIAELNTIAPTVLWALDSIRRIGLTPEVLAAFAKVCFFEPSDAELFPAGHYVPIGFDGETYRPPHPRPTPTHDLVWVGSAHEDRLARLEDIAVFARDHGYDFGAYGYFYKPARAAEFAARWPALTAAIRRNERISPAAARDVYARARIGVNLHFHDPVNLGVNPRTFEVPGTGSFLLTDDKPVLAELLEPDREIGVFTDPDSFAAQARRWLDDEPARAAAAARAAARVHAEHTFACRAGTIRNLVEATP